MGFHAEPNQAESLLLGVRHDTQGILSLLRKHSLVVASQARVHSKAPKERSPGVAQAVREVAVARREPVAVVQRGGHASDARPRDAQGRFIKVNSGPQKQPEAAPVSRAVQALVDSVQADGRQRREERMEDRLRDGGGRFRAKDATGSDSSMAGRVGALGGAAGEAAGNALSGAAGMDPTLAAVEEMRWMASAAKTVVSPVARGIGAVTGWGGSHEQKQTGWLKRIALSLGWSRKDAKVHASQQVRALRDVAKAAGKEKGGGGLLSMLSSLVGFLPGVLKRMLLPGMVGRFLGSGLPFSLGGGGPGALSGAWSWAKGAVGLVGAGATGSVAGKAMGALGKGGGAALKLLGRTPVVGTALTGLLAWMNDADIRNDASLTPEQRKQARAENLGGALGSLAGGAIGLAIGGPVGLAIGSWLGAEGGKILGEPMLKVYEFISKLEVWEKLGKFVDDTESAWEKFTGWVASKVGFTKRDASAAAAALQAQTAGAPSFGGGVGPGFESGGNPNKVSSGKGDPGGPSYGLYQLATNTGSLSAFLSGSKYGKEFAGLQPGTPQFKKKWEEVNARDPAGFQFDQLDFIRKNNVIPASNALKAAGIDLSGRGRAVQEMLFSTATQFGPGGPNTEKGAFALIKNALSGKSLPSLSDADIVSAVQGYKLSHNAELFRSSSADVQAGTARRAVAEQSVLLGTAGAASMPATAVPNVPAINPPPARPAVPVVVPQPQEPASVPQRISTAVPPTVVIQPASQPPGQDVPDRGIAHVASGGIGWRTV